MMSEMEDTMNSTGSGEVARGGKLDQGEWMDGTEPYTATSATSVTSGCRSPRHQNHAICTLNQYRGSEQVTERAGE